MAQGTFPVETKRTIPGVSGSVRANLPTDTGAGLTGEALSGVGAELVRIGLQSEKEVVEKTRLRQLEEVRIRKNLDANSAKFASDNRKLAEENIKAMKLVTPPELWEQEAAKIIQAANAQNSTLDFSAEAAVEQGIIASGFSAIEGQKAFTEGASRLRDVTITTQEDRLTGLFRSGDPDNIALGIRDSAEILRLNGKSAGEISAIINAASEAGKKLKAEDAISGKRNQASVFPELTVAEMGTELEARKKGEGDPALASIPSDDLINIKKFASGIVKEREAGVTKEVNLATSNAVSGWSDIIADPEKELSGSEVWNTPIEVPPEFEKDVGTLKNVWAGIAQGLADRKLAQQKGTKKKDREDAYDPELAAALKTEARDAASPEDVETVRRKAADALKEDKIDDADNETINLDAPKAFNTVVDRTIREEDVRFKSIILKGTSSESLRPWLQGQILAIQATGKTITSETTNELLKTFSRVGRAKEWAAGQTLSTVRAEMDNRKKEGKAVTVNDTRLLYLQTEKIWLRKSDTELVKEYDAWLARKP